jgi:hypothetical protein
MFSGKKILNFTENESGIFSIVPSKSKEKRGSRGINSGLTYYFSLNIVILSYAWTKLVVILVGANESPLRLTSVSFCGKRKTPIVAIGVLLSFNYVSIKPVMSSKSRYMVGSKSRWAKKQTIPYVQSATRMSTSCLPPPPNMFTASRNRDYIHVHQTMSIFKNHIICLQANFCSIKTLDKHLGGSGFES